MHKEQPKTERKSTAIYVTGLPLNVMVHELNDLFQKCDVISEKIETGKPRIKIYNNEYRNSKEDALVIFFKLESINIAILRFNETDFRFGKKNLNDLIRIEAAETSYKKQQDAPPKEGGNNKNRKQALIRLAWDEKSEADDSSGASVYRAAVKSFSNVRRNSKSRGIAD
jgi:HIV Tat-specific factor 1